MPRFDMVSKDIGQPARKMIERVARGILETYRQLPFVAVDCFHEGRARAIRSGGDLPRQRCCLERCADIRQRRSDNHHPLSRLHVERNSHGELGIGLQLAIVHKAFYSSQEHQDHPSSSSVSIAKHVR